MFKCFRLLGLGFRAIRKLGFYKYMNPIGIQHNRVFSPTVPAQYSRIGCDILLALTLNVATGELCKAFAYRIAKCPCRKQQSVVFNMAAYINVLQ